MTVAIGGQMYDASDDQIASLLENRALLHRALTLAAREAAGGDGPASVCRIVVWISEASMQLSRVGAGSRIDMKAEIRACSVAEIFDAANAKELLAAYAAECMVAGASPQRPTYEAMEKAGALQCFGAYVAGELVGFVSVLASIMPHNGRLLATVESLFVAQPYRSSRAADGLLSAAEEFAGFTECESIVYTARKGSALEAVLSRRRGCVASHTMFTKWFE